MKVNRCQRLASAVTLSLLLMCGTHARADSAEELFKEAMTRFSFARFDLSLKLLNKARGKTKNPMLLARIHLYLGINQAVMGDTRAARESFRVALAHNPTVDVDPKKLKMSIVQLFRKVQGQLKGRLVVTANIPAMVHVDGVKAGKVPYDAAVSVGTHRVDVRGKHARSIHSQQVVVAPGKKTVVQATLKLPPAQSGSWEWKDDQPSFWGRPRLWTWVAAGGAVASMIVGIGLGASASSDHDEYMATSSRAHGEELADSVESKALGANVAFGVAGALVVTSAVLLFFEGRSAGGKERAGGQQMGTRIMPLVGTTSGVVLTTSF